jgi:hypothetical protein
MRCTVVRQYRPVSASSTMEVVHVLPHAIDHSFPDVSYTALVSLFTCVQCDYSGESGLMVVEIFGPQLLV